MQEAMWKMVVAIAKQATNLAILDLQHSGIARNGLDLCASLSETNITSLTMLRMCSNDVLFDTEDKCTQWRGIIKKQTGLVHMEPPVYAATKAH